VASLDQNRCTATLLRKGLTANFLEKSLIKNRHDGVINRRNGFAQAFFEKSCEKFCEKTCFLKGD
jgi:hypothetical protein